MRMRIISWGKRKKGLNETDTAEKRGGKKKG